MQFSPHAVPLLGLGQFKASQNITLLMVHRLQEQPQAPGVFHLRLCLKQNTPRETHGDTGGRRRGNRLAESHFCWSKPAVGLWQGLVWAGFFSPFDVQFCFALFCFTLSRSIALPVESFTSRNQSSCFLLALAGHAASGEHLKGVENRAAEKGSLFLLGQHVALSPAENGNAGNLQHTQEESSSSQTCFPPAADLVFHSISLARSGGRSEGITWKCLKCLLWFEWEILPLAASSTDQSVSCCLHT